MLSFWLIFLAFVALLLALDLGVFHKKDHKIGVSEALVWTFVWIILSLLFGIAIYFLYEKGHVQHIDGMVSGSEAVLEYLSGYIIEKSLSLDNIFVIAAIFSYFKIPDKFQHRVLFWGIIGAILLRGAFILAGSALIQHFNWIMYLFGALLLYSAFKMLFANNSEEQDLGRNKIVVLAKKIFPMTTEIQDHSFFIRDGRKLLATPLFLALLVVEISDVLFAVDSIPAIFGVTLDPFIVFSSNIMAILGLRSLYFALAAILGKFEKLKYAIVFILAFVGVKMLIVQFCHIPSAISLAVILLSLAFGIAASLLSKKSP